AGAATTGAGGAAAAAPQPTECPPGMTATCYAGQVDNGAYYSIAIPADWNGDLVMHAHGGPGLGAPTPQRSADDLARWSVMVREGYAWAGSSYRRGGYGARMAVADTEALRRLFVATYGQPRRTFAHGQSWGGNVAAKLVETYRSGYDAALITNGIVSGTGYQSAPADRTPGQQRNLDDILGVTRVPERTLFSHLRFATFTFRDIVSDRLGGRNPFSNSDVRYTGSHDDKALNAGVERFAADPSAVRDLSYDSDLTGAVSIPVLTLHAIEDPTVFVEHESAYRATRAGAGTGDGLVQLFTRENEHSVLSQSEYASAITALAGWVETGRKPTPASVSASCPEFDQVYGTGCFFDPGYVPGSYESRVYPRSGARHWPAMTAAQAEAWSHIDGVGIAP
ncbi:MAG: alpha/beta hydrolase family protein, partial [Micromonosporaceae bacterium]